MAENILSVQDLHTSFHTDNGEVMAVNGVNFNLAAGKILNHTDAPEWALKTPVELIIETAVVGTFSRLLSEKLLLLEGHTLEDGDDITIVDKKR